MAKLRVLRRPDGIIELRKPRLRDRSMVVDAAMLLATCAGCIGFIAAVAALVVKMPGILAIAAALALPLAAAIAVTRDPALAPAPARRRPRTAPDDAA